MAKRPVRNDSLIGKVFPTFDWLDISGTHLTNETILGKTVVVKCWFIKCPQCIEEMPAFNELANEYHARNDVIFLSLAWDLNRELRGFLGPWYFKYYVVPDQRQFLTERLGLRIYPTHLIIDESGKIATVANGYAELENGLRELERKLQWP